MKRIALFLVALLAIAPACVSVKMFRTGEGVAYPPTAPAKVLVFFSAEDVKRPYDVIGEILAEGSSGWGANDSSLIEKAQVKAAGIGAQAIIVTKEKAAGVVAAQLLGAADKKQRIQAIRFKE